MTCQPLNAFPKQGRRHGKIRHRGIVFQKSHRRLGGAFTKNVLSSTTTKAVTDFPITMLHPAGGKDQGKTSVATYENTTISPPSIAQPDVGTLIPKGSLASSGSAKIREGDCAASVFRLNSLSDFKKRCFSHKKSLMSEFKTNNINCLKYFQALVILLLNTPVLQFAGCGISCSQKRPGRVSTVHSSKLTPKKYNKLNIMR